VNSGFAPALHAVPLLPCCGVGENKLPFCQQQSWQRDCPQGQRGFLRINEAGEKLRVAIAAGGLSVDARGLSHDPRSHIIYTNPW